MISAWPDRTAAACSNGNISMPVRIDGTSCSR
jgi:hypothetical protein